MKISKCIYALRKMSAEMQKNDERSNAEALDFAMGILQEIDDDPKKCLSSRIMNIPVEREKGVGKMKGVTKNSLGTRVLKVR